MNEDYPKTWSEYVESTAGQLDYAIDEIKHLKEELSEAHSDLVGKCAEILQAKAEAEHERNNFDCCREELRRIQAAIWDELNRLTSPEMPIYPSVIAFLYSLVGCVDTPRPAGPDGGGGRTTTE